MLIDTRLCNDGLAVINLSGRLVHASSLRSLSSTIHRLEQGGRRGLLVDLSKVTKVNLSGVAALVELIAQHPKSSIGFCNLPKKASDALQKSGLDRGLKTFPNVSTARTLPEFKSYTLTNTKAVLLYAGKGSRVAPLTDIVPKPMLDIAGKPALHRILDHLESFGLRNVIFNPGHLGHQIIDYFNAEHLPDHNILFANEGRGSSTNWVPSPIGSASTLKHLQECNSAFNTDFFVLCGDALIDLDLADMMRAHRESGADVTIAALTVDTNEIHKYGIMEVSSSGTINRFMEKPKLGATTSRLANTGIYLFKPWVLDLICNKTGQDIACDLLPIVMAAGGKMKVYSNSFSWVDIGCGRDYARACELTLHGRAAGATPIGVQLKPDVWSSPNAFVSRRARISGPCYVGSGARIEADAKIEGVCSIGAGAVIEGGTLIRNSVIMPSTRVQKGAWVEQMIVHSDWAVDHTRADGTIQNQEPLDCVLPANVLPTTGLRKLA